MMYCLQWAATMLKCSLWMLPGEVTMSCWMNAWKLECLSMPWTRLAALLCMVQLRLVTLIVFWDSWRSPSWSWTCRWISLLVFYLGFLRIYEIKRSWKKSVSLHMTFLVCEIHLTIFIYLYWLGTNHLTTYLVYYSHRAIWYFWNFIYRFVFKIFD